MPKPRVLIVDGDAATRKLYKAFLVDRGFDVQEAATGLSALGWASCAQVVVLNAFLPEMNGWEVTEHLQSNHPDTPVMMITTQSSSEQMLHAFSLGVDDYMIKPIDLREFEARIRVMIRRNGLSTPLIRGDLAIQLSTRSVFVAAQRISLSPLEFELLRTLALHPGRIWSRSDLLQAVWGEDYFGVDRTVDVRVATIRRKLGERPDGGQYIETIRNHGYRFTTTLTD